MIIKNPYTNTNPLAPVRFAVPLAVAFQGVEIYDGFQQDGRTFGHNTQKQIVGASYGVAGAILGAKIGAVAGAFFFGVGAVPALVIGGFVGGFIGGMVGEEGSEYVYDKVNETTQ